MHENFTNHNHNSQKSRALAPIVKTPRPCHACARYSYEDASSGKADRRGSQPRLHNKSPLLIVADRPRVISIQLRNTISVLIMRIGSPIHESDGGIAKSTMRRDSPNLAASWTPPGQVWPTCFRKDQNVKSPLQTPVIPARGPLDGSSSATKALSMCCWSLKLSRSFHMGVLGKHQGLLVPKLCAILPTVIKPLRKSLAET